MRWLLKYVNYQKIQVIVQVMKQTANHGCQMNHMSRSVLFEQISRRLQIAETISQRKSNKIKQLSSNCVYCFFNNYSLEIRFFGTGEYPPLVGRRLGFDDCSDGTAHQPRAAGDQNHFGHPRRVVETWNDGRRYAKTGEETLGDRNGVRDNSRENRETRTVLRDSEKNQTVNATTFRNPNDVLKIEWLDPFGGIGRRSMRRRRTVITHR